MERRGGVAIFPRTKEVVTGVRGMVKNPSIPVDEKAALLLGWSLYFLLGFPYLADLGSFPYRYWQARRTRRTEDESSAELRDDKSFMDRRGNISSLTQKDGNSLRDTKGVPSFMGKDGKASSPF